MLRSARLVRHLVRGSGKLPSCSSVCWKPPAYVAAHGRSASSAANRSIDSTEVTTTVRPDVRGETPNKNGNVDGRSVGQIFDRLAGDVQKFERFSIIAMADDFDGIVRRLESGDEEVVAFLKGSTSAVAFALSACGDIMAYVPFQERIAIFDRLLTALKKQGISLANLGIHHKILHVRLENGQSFSPADVLKALAADGLEANAETFAYLVTQYCRDGDITGALAIVAHMKAKQMSVDETVLRDLVYAYGLSGADDKAEQLITQLQASNQSVSTTRLRLALARAKAKVGDIDAMVGHLDKVAVDGGAEEEGNFDVMFRDYWLLEVFYALAESNRKEHYDKVLSRVKDFKFKPKMHFISRLISLGNYEAAMSFQNFAASTKAEDDSSVRDTAVILRAMSWAFHRATAADEDSLNTLSSTIATALNAMDSNRGSSSSSKNVPVAIHWDMFLRFVARMATGGADSLGPALKSLTAKINKKLKFSRKQMTKLEELYSSLGLTEALPHAGQRTPQYELNVDEDRVQSLIDADVADAKRTPKVPKPAVNRRRPVGDRTLDVKVNEEGIQELIDANALPSSGKITRRPQKSNEMLNSIEEQFAEGLVNADFESLQSPRRRRTPPAAKLTKREKKPEDPDDISIRDLVREDKLEEAFNKALELSKQRERVPGHYYLLEGALVSNDSKFLQKLMQLLNVKNGETNSLTDFLYVLLDLNKLAVAKKLITGANVELKPTKLAYLTSKACDDDKPHILTGFLDLTSDSKIIDAISRDAIYGKLIFYHCTQMDERNLEATVARIRDEKLELSDKRRTQIAMAMRAFGKPNPFKDSSPPSPSFDASFLPKENSPSQRPESSL